MTAMDDYLKQIGKDLLAGHATEHTHRAALERLIEALGLGLDAVNEPRRVRCGAPDFVIRRAATPIGHIETKDVGVSLDAVERTEQMARYLGALGNLILTDYLEFRWYVAGQWRLTARLAAVGPDRRLRRERDGARQVGELLAAFAVAQAVTVGTAQELAERMAGIARLIRDTIRNAFAVEEEADEDAASPLHAQLDGFREVLLHDLTAEQFADMYAQTICYGLFAARVHNGDAAHFTRESAAQTLPRTNPFMRWLFGHIVGQDMDDRIAWAVDDLIELLARADMAAILQDFGRRTRREDPVIHFYETFLRAYDPVIREARGVYYTPEPVVSYIVRSVDHLLRAAFGCASGLAEASTIRAANPDASVMVKGKRAPRKTREVHRVLILDPACGTGTFLHAVIERIYAALAAQGQTGAWSSYVREHLLPRLYGFELLMAPYAVAHLKLGLQLQSLGYDFYSDERLRVFMTNTLEEPHEFTGLPLFATALAQEVREANAVKRELPIMVVLGNPPYSYESQNNGSWISELIRDYYQVDGKSLGERNPRGLQDDYVKFIRFAQWRIEQTGYGVLAFISNNGYLDNPTFRGMRQSLMQTFDEIYVLDLHGSAKKRERAPDGTPDENVFDIMQGVAVGLFVKRGGNKGRGCAVRHADLWGLREVYEAGANGERELCGGKYHWLWANDLTTTEWQTLVPESPFYLFIPQDTKLWAEYDAWWKITDIMPVYTVGLYTGRDRLAVHYSPDDALATVRDFRSLPVEEARDKYALGEDTRDWRVAFAQKDISDHGASRNRIVPIHYRPFDRRYTYYTGRSRGFICMPRPEVMGHVLGGENLVLITSRMTKGEAFQHAQVGRDIVEKICLSSKTSNNGFAFPLYLYPTEGELPGLAGGGAVGRRVNLSPAFLAALEGRLGLHVIDRSAGVQPAEEEPVGDRRSTCTPEEVLGYLYAVLHSPTYRARYAEFLKIDFPRVPLTGDIALFRELARLGGELIALHLLEAPRLGALSTRFPQAGDGLVDKVVYAPPQEGQAGRVYINPTQYFEGVPPDVWTFQVGGYQPLEKWLKDRKGRRLSFDDLLHYQKIVVALQETRRLMAEVDEVIAAHGGWPIT